MRSVRPLQLTVLLAFFLALPLPFFAQTQSEPVLTNTDVIKMMKAGLPESVIVRVVQISPTNFATTPAALIELKKHGASEGILGAVLDSRMGPPQYGSEPMPTARVATQTAHGLNSLNHLPTFEADVKFKGNTDGKLKVSHNNIKVEKAGVPLFSLKWKDNPPAKQ